MAEAGFARLKPKAEKGVPKSPPIPSDQAQSDVHHVDSVRYNLAHASAHLGEAQKHATALTDLMSSMPSTAPHVANLQGALT